MQAFKDMLDAIGIGWLVKPVAIIIVLGGIAHLSPWIIGPAKGIAAVARRGDLPPAMGRLSRNQIPTTGLVVQAIGGTAFSLLFLFLPNANTSYGILTAMTAQVIIVRYILLFAALIKLRYSKPDVERSYRLPGGKPGAWLICGAGIFGCSFAFIAGVLSARRLGHMGQPRRSPTTGSSSAGSSCSRCHRSSSASSNVTAGPSSPRTRVQRSSRARRLSNSVRLARLPGRGLQAPSPS